METTGKETPFTLDDIRELQDYIGLIKTADPREMTFADDVPAKLQMAWMIFVSAKNDLNIQLEKYDIQKV